MKTLLFTFALLLGLAGCASSSGGANYDSFTEDKTSIYEG